MGTLRYGVVTRVPDAGKGEAGNMALSPVYQMAEEPRESNGWLGRVRMLFDLSLRMPVFTKGEVLILDGDREPHGPMRNPGKWDVDVEYCDTLEAAIERAAEVLG